MLGRTLNGRYKLTRILGAGGFGQTYLATDLLATDLSAADLSVTDLSAADLSATGLQAEKCEGERQLPAVRSDREELCVVKQLRPASQDKNFLQVARRLFDTESKTLKDLGHHPQIPNSIDFFEEGNEFYLVQEYIEGQSLEEEIKQVGQFSEVRAIALLEAVLPILGFIHDNHVIHRDLKPDNLIRRQDTKEIVLIDFGAVKELRTHLVTGERTGLTIGIGTQGYTPSEQLSGKPRYSSDIYALGMTVIHALTGRLPADLPEAMGSLEPQWQDYADVSPGLKILLGKMTRHYIHQRYQRVEEVLHDLSRLDELPVEAAQVPTTVETSMPQGLLASEAQTTIVRWRMGRRAKRLTVAISTLLTSAFILGLRQVGAFVPAELAVWDRLVSAQADAGPDPRLLIVEIAEADLRATGNFTPSDADLAQVIDNLQAHQPARIAVDLLRNVPEGAGQVALQASLKDPNVVGITKLSDPESDNMIPPPPGMVMEQLSFSNLVVDADFRVRRSLMVDFFDEALLVDALGERLVGTEADFEPQERPIFSLGTEVALGYIEQYLGVGPEEGDILQLGEVRFEPINRSFGGYQHADDSGYQIFMRYRSQGNVADRLSFSDVLNNNFDPEQVKDKIVLIGSMAENSRDVFLTPYNTAGNFQLMHGVEVHAQAASQILSVVIDGEPLPWAWPDGLEIAWIVALTGIGSGLMVLTQKGPVLILFGVSGLTLTFLVGMASFHAGGWVPVAAPMSAFFFSAAGARISKSYQRRHWEAKQSTLLDSE
ncbi:MAG: CHASE2 domain-containing protein [Cyanobacteria bacterium J06627_32]